MAGPDWGRRAAAPRLAAAAVSLALAAPAAAAPPNPIAAENALRGATDWGPTAPAAPGQLEAYAGAASVEHGEPVAIHARADAVHQVTWTLYRVGYYGGAGARAVARGGPVTVFPEPLPTPDLATGLLECEWPATFTIGTDPTWASGVYLVKLTRDDGVETYAIFVVRADERKGVGVVQASVATWQAYNDWGGESLYTTSIGLAGGYAKAVSFDRPYASGFGTGEFFFYEAPFVTWVESAGYDVTYLTNVDVGRDPSLLVGQKLFVSVGHDEYWTRDERLAVEGAVAAGVNAAFLSANTAYQQIRIEPSSSGDPWRTEVCYKDLAPSLDPLAGTPLVTTLFRAPALDEPENALLGVMAEAWQLADVPWIVGDAGSWVYAGTGLRPGDVLPLVVGYEADRVVDNGRTPAGLTVLAHSPLVGHDGRGGWHDASLYTAESGAFVFAAGVIHWARALSEPHHADGRVQRMTANVLAAAGLLPATPAADFGASRGGTIVAGTPVSVELLAGAPGEEGFVDGPLAQARFRRPSGIAADRAGNLFVADTGNHAIRMVDAAGDRRVTTIAGTGSPGAGEGAGARLRDPQGVAVAGDGTVFVADTGNHRIVRIAREGGWAVTTWAGSPSGASGSRDGPGTAARFALPMGVAAVGQDLYVTDTHNQRLRRIDARGSVSTVAGGAAGRADGPGSSARLYRPTGVAATAGGALLVVDTGNRLVRSVALDGAYTTTTLAGGAEGGADGAAPNAGLMPLGGIAEQGGGVLVSDVGTARIRLVAGGRVTTYVGDAPRTFSVPMGIVALADGSVVVVDEGDSTLRRVTPRPLPGGPGPGNPDPPPVPEPAVSPPGPASAGPARSGGCASGGAAPGWLAWALLLAAYRLGGGRRARG